MLNCVLPQVQGSVLPELWVHRVVQLYPPCREAASHEQNTQYFIQLFAIHYLSEVNNHGLPVHDSESRRRRLFQERQLALALRKNAFVFKH